MPKQVALARIFKCFL
jgi:hypothetical protein